MTDDRMPRPDDSVPDGVAGADGAGAGEVVGAGDAKRADGVGSADGGVAADGVPAAGGALAAGEVMGAADAEAAADVVTRDEVTSPADALGAGDTAAAAPGSAGAASDGPAASDVAAEDHLATPHDVVGAEDAVLAVDARDGAQLAPAPTVGPAPVIPAVEPVSPDVDVAADASPLPGAHRGGFSRLPTAPVAVTTQTAPAEPGSEYTPAEWAPADPTSLQQGLSAWALGFAILGLIVSLFVGWGFPIGLVAVVIAIVALRRPVESRAIAIWALVLGTVSILYSAGWLLYAGLQMDLFG